MEKLSRRDRTALEAAEQVRGGGEYKRTECPFCLERVGSPDRRRNFWVHHESGFWGCWRCGIKGRLPGHEDDIDQWLPPDEPADEDVDQAIPVPDEYVPATQDRPELRRGQMYLKSRRVTRAIAIQAKVGIAVSGDLAGRVIVPALALNGEAWVGYSARLYREPKGPWERKYETAAGMDRKHLLYNLRALTVHTDTPLMLMEGVFDALPYWPDATAFFGKPSPGQLEAFPRCKRPLVACLDGDAWREAEVLARQLRRMGCGAVGWVRLPAKTDPGVLDQQRLREAARTAAENGHADY